MENIELKMIPSDKEPKNEEGEIEVKQETEQGTDESLARRNLHSRELYLMRYGEVSPDHPAYSYVKEIVDKLPNSENLGIKIRIIPDRFQSNAFALPDGTIVITSHLLEYAEYYESLAGAIAHEKTHIEKEHAKPEEQRKPSDYQEYFELGLKKLARRRLNEYEADLRSAFGDLEKAGINPLGLKILLQKFSQREGYDDVHGDSMDRALNIATGSYLMDLKSLSNNLTKAPPELTESLKQVPAAEFAAIFSRPKDYPGIFTPYEQRIQKRHESISLIKDPDQLLIALSTVGGYCRKKQAPDFDPDDESCLEELTKKAISHLESKFGSKDRLATLLLLSYFSGISPEQLENYYPVSPEKAESLPRIVEFFEKTVDAKPFRYALSSAPNFCLNLVKYLSKHNLIKKEDGNSINTLDEVFYRLETAYSTNAPIEGEVARTVILTTESVQEGEKTDEDEKESADLSVWEKVKVGSNPKVIEIIRQNIKGFDIDNLYKAIPKIAKSLSEELGSGSLDEMVNILVDTQSVLREYFNTLVFLSKTRREKLDESMNILERYALLKLFTYCANKIDLKNKMSSKQFEMYKLLFMQEFAGDSLQIDIKFFAKKFTPEPPESSHGDVETYSEEYDEDQDYLEEALRDIEHEERIKLGDDSGYTIEEQLSQSEMKALSRMELEVPKYGVGENKLLVPVDKQTITDAYRIFIDPKYRQEKKLDVLGADSLTRGVRGREFFVRMVDVYATQGSLAEFVAFINENQKELDHLIPSLNSRSRLLGNISLKIAQACEDGTLWKFPLKDIVTLSNFIDNPFIRNEILSKGFEKNWDSLSFEEKSALLFPEKGQKGIVDFKLREKFLCEEVKTKEQHEKIKQTVERSIDDLFSTTSAGMGGAVLADRIGYKYSDPVRFLQGALVTSSGDQKLREWLDNFVMSATHSFYTEEAEMTESEGAEEYANREKFIVERVIQQLYTLDEVGRRMFVRKLLVGADGLLRNEDNRRKFFDAIFESWLKKEGGQEDLSGVLEKIKESLAQESSWELLYFAIQGILSDKVFIPPKETETQAVRPSSIARAKSYDKQGEKVILAAIRLRDALANGGTTKPRKQKISPVEFVKETAGNLGALGRRFLQVLPQFVELSPDYEREFSDVYDKVTGQSKFAAISTAEREWPAIWDELSEIGNRVGGGSIVTVYHAVNKNGREEVLKVRNPNILYHLEEAEKVALSVSDRLSLKYGGSFSQARSIIPDITTWVTNDVNFEGFLEKDAQFRQQYQGFTVEGNQYKIRIPESFGPQSAYFSREEYIPGINLTSIDEIIKSDKHNAKQAIGLLAKFYVQQIMDGRLHSDIHPGNFAVTDKNELVVYDRNYYIDLTVGINRVVHSSCG